MARKNSVPNYSELITVTYAALKALGGSGKNDEINNKAAEILGLSDDVLEVPHLNSSSLSEINYRLAWARTLLKRSGAIANSARAVWAISPSFSDVAEVDGAAINKAYQYDCFYTPPELAATKREIEECHRALIEALGKPERRLVLKIIDAKDHISEDTSLDSFISGFRLAWRLSAELNHYDDERPARCQAAEKPGARFTFKKEDDEQ